MKPSLLLLLALPLVAACAPLVVDEQGRPLGYARRGAGPAAPAGEAAPAATAGASVPTPTRPQAPLVGWDGSAVADGAPAQDAPDRALEPGQGRMRIIELYQQVLDERDALRDELEASASALEAAQRQRVELEEENRSLRARVVALENGQESMQAENLDLAARLTTAQIRRLEAEKALLEARIGELRAHDASSPMADQARAPAPVAGSKP